MKKNVDYEQLYYDELYENRILRNKIQELEQELKEINLCRTKKNINLQKYIILQIKNKEAKDDNKNTINV